MNSSPSNRADAGIVLAGGSGFLGRILARHFTQLGHPVTVLSRFSEGIDGDIRSVRWDGRSLGDWTDHLDGALALINLAGCSVNCRYHARNRRLIMDSRVDSTRILGEAIQRCTRPPRVWFNSSTATIYQHTFGPAWDETGRIGAHPDAKDAFSVDVAAAWEKEFENADTPKTRKVTLRSAMVLGAGSNSVFPMLRKLVRMGLGGRMGNGRQLVSWIHERDFCRAVAWLIERGDIEGVVNVAAPQPLPNAEMMRVLREVCGVPFGLPAARWMLETGAFLLRTETELIIKSRRVIPRRLLEHGFQFQYRDIRGAVDNLHEIMK